MCFQAEIQNIWRKTKIELPVMNETFLACVVSNLYYPILIIPDAYILWPIKTNFVKMSTSESFIRRDVGLFGRFFQPPAMAPVLSRQSVRSQERVCRSESCRGQQLTRHSRGEKSLKQLSQPSTTSYYSTSSCVFCFQTLSVNYLRYVRGAIDPFHCTLATIFTSRQLDI